MSLPWSGAGRLSGNAGYWCFVPGKVVFPNPAENHGLVGLMAIVHLWNHAEISGADIYETMCFVRNRVRTFPRGTFSLFKK
jgi:hypothetical protein